MGELVCLTRFTIKLDDITVECIGQCTTSEAKQTLNDSLD